MDDYKNSLGRYLQKKRTKSNDFTIISNDCWGAEVYRYLGLQYNTPFVGLFIMAPCYIKLLQHFEQNIHTPLSFINKSKYQQNNENRAKKNKNYPIGLINDDIEIHFLHYSSENEALDNWTRRVARINFEKLYLKFDCGKDLCSYKHIKAFENLPFQNKLCLSPQIYTEFKSIIYIKDWEADGAKMFCKTLKVFDVIGWINNSEIKKSILYKIISSLILSI